MTHRLRVLAKKLSRKGFVGPRYHGISGKVRFLRESVLGRRELVFVLRPEQFRAVDPPPAEAMSLKPISKFDEVEEHRKDIEDRWYPGIIEGWRGPWSWGEQFFLGMRGGRPISFNWLQVGTPSGAPVYWGRVLDDEYRILRGGVAPGWRGQGVNTRMKYEIINALFDQGATRVFAECYEANIPSVRTLERLGFQKLAVLQVIEVPGLRNFVRWKPLE